MNLALTRFLIALFGIFGPIVCYFLVYGFSFLVKYLVLLIRANRFQKRMRIANTKLDSDNGFNGMVVDVISSNDVQMIKSEKCDQVENENNKGD